MKTFALDKVLRKNMQCYQELYHGPLHLKGKFARGRRGGVTNPMHHYSNELEKLLHSSRWILQYRWKDSVFLDSLGGIWAITLMSRAIKDAPITSTEVCIPHTFCCRISNRSENPVKKSVMSVKIKHAWKFYVRCSGV